MHIVACLFHVAIECGIRIRSVAISPCHRGDLYAHLVLSYTIIRLHVGDEKFFVKSKANALRSATPMSHVGMWYLSMPFDT